MIVAHRGAPRPNEPENAVFTFEQAIKRGAAFVEMDIRKSRDGIFVLNHDATLDRSTTGTGPVADHDWAVLRELHLRDLRGLPTTHRMNKLDEALEWARDRVPIWFDVKDNRLYEEVTRYLRQRHALGQGVVLTFNLNDTLRVHGAAADACIYNNTYHMQRKHV